MELAPQYEVEGWQEHQFSTPSCRPAQPRTLCCCYQGLIHCLTQEQHGKGRERWGEAGGAAEARGE